MSATIISIFIILVNPVELYNQGNEFYNNGNFPEAIAAYENAIQQVNNAYLYYNLGNSYYKSGSLGKAILNYRRAHFLAPRDADISYNLSFVRNYRSDKITIHETPISRFLWYVFNFFSLREAQIITTCLFLLTTILASVFVIYRRKYYGYASLVGFIFCLLFFINWQVWSHTIRARHAVVTAQKVNALSGPGEDYKEILLLHDGAEVQIKDERGDYALIKLPGGMGGWVQKQTLEQIF